MIETYSSSNEDGLLKSLGPHRLSTAGEVLYSVIGPTRVTPTYKVRVGEVIVYEPSGAKKLPRKTPSTKPLRTKQS